MASTGGIIQSNTPGITQGIGVSTISSLIAGNVTPVTVASNELMEFLAMVNGTDAYNSATVAMGKLDIAEYLRVPIGFKVSTFNAYTTGQIHTNNAMGAGEFEQIYALNKEAFGTDERAIKIGLLRALAVRVGWLTGTYEVKEVAAHPDPVSVVEKDLVTIKRIYPTAVKLAALLPLASEFVFRTMGHHYLTGLSPEYDAKYQKFFNACVEPNLTAYLSPADLYHKTLHWVSLVEAAEVSRNSDASIWLPNAVVIRTSSAPAGTAIIATSVAILAAMDGTGLKQALKEASGAKIDELEAVAVTIASDPGKYHTIPVAYGKTAPTGDAKLKFDLAKAEAIKLAPVLQGFLDALPNSSSLAQARALAKHADANPLLRKRAKVFFKEIGTAKAGNMVELFMGDKRTKEAVAVESVEDTEV